MMTTYSMVMFLSAAVANLPTWKFDTQEDLRAWVPNRALAKVELADGILHAEAVEWDPFFSCRDVSFQTDPGQYVLIRLKANRSGTGELFWSGQLAGKHGGLSAKKKTRFAIEGDQRWHDIAIFPFWHTAKTIRQLRLDVFDGARFEIDSIRILQRPGGEKPQTDRYSWELKGKLESWRVHPAVRELFAPPLRLKVRDRGWVTVRLRSDRDGEASVLWGTAGASGLFSQPFSIVGDGKFRSYNLEMNGLSGWTDDLVAFGIRLPNVAREHVELDSIRIAATPSGPAELAVSYFGFENGVNRAGRSCSVLALIENRGGTTAAGANARLVLPAEVTLVEGTTVQRIPELGFGDRTEVVWKVLAEKPAKYEAQLILEGVGSPIARKESLRFSKRLDLPKADYVPAPRPVETDIDVCAYYFPGWNSEAKWNCIRDVAPNRKPLLGYYDEANPECVDWQIKWAVENGIRCFLVDWYWIDGQRHLEHWFEAYRKARYRDQLQIAIMWANHNPPKTHSREDWRQVTRHWIERYFSMKTYYRIDGKPAVFIWSPGNIRNDLGGTVEVKKALAESQTMARKAGYPGIRFVALGYGFSESRIKTLLEEGYVGVTTYHEWGTAGAGMTAGQRLRFEDVVRTVSESWERKREGARELTYYPVVDTGWDARPWHGAKSLVISGRTPTLFENLLAKAKSFCRQHGQKMVILGPVNEWGEGSYIEPCTEFGFDMLESVRRVFAKGDPARWPVNVAPSDVGLGGYDFPVRPRVTAWTFDRDAEGWSPLMGVTNVSTQAGALRFRTSTSDPALVVGLHRVKASSFPKAVLRMKITGQLPSGAMGQLFWASGGRPSTEATSVRFPLADDGKFHTYELNLAGNPRWRGQVSTLRFDPCTAKDVTVTLDHFELRR